MKTNTRILTAFLLFGMTTIGQDLNYKFQNLDYKNLASNQNHTDNVNSQLTKAVYSDSAKVKKLRDVPWFVERYKISAGYYWALNNTDIKVSGNSGNIGTDVDFENDLGFSTNSSSIFAEAEWRSTSRSRFMFSYYNSKRNSTHNLPKEITIGDETYPVNAEIYSYFNNDIYRFSYGYAILSKPKYEIGLSVGTHVLGSTLGVGVRNSNNVSLEKVQNFNLTAPLPNFGIWGGYVISDKFAVNGEFDYLAFKIDNVNGKILSLNFSVLYKALKNLELSTGLTGLNFNLKSTNDNFNGNIRWGNNGLFLKTAYTFGNIKWN